MQYQWVVLQDGRLPLDPDGSIDRSVEHVCTATLVWPPGVPPSAENSLVVDPSFGVSGLEDAEPRLEAVGGSLETLAHYFESHRHFDHVLRVRGRFLSPDDLESADAAGPRWTPVFPHSVPTLFPGIEAIATPGHASELTCLRFPAADGDVWIVGDAILSRPWLTAWRYYWPNGYGPREIVETWRSVARILASADVIVPGHGPPIRVDIGLLREVLDNFPQARYAHECPEVADPLRDRLQRMLCER